MRVVQVMIAACFSALAITTTASADNVTVATFADPSSSSSSPLFSYNAGTGILTGGWSGAGLLLQTPGLLAAPDYANAKFTMTPLTTVATFGGIYQMGGGQINFVDSGNAPLLTITFGNAVLTGSLGLGASDFYGYNVTFSGPLVSGNIISNEAFSFSFANPSAIPTAPSGSFQVTSSFTSSADLIVPAPGAMALLGVGGLFAARRRR